MNSHHWFNASQVPPPARLSRKAAVRLAIRTACLTLLVLLVVLHTLASE